MEYSAIVDPEYAKYLGSVMPRQSRAPQNVGEGLTYIGEKLNESAWRNVMLKQMSDDKAKVSGLWGGYASALKGGFNQPQTPASISSSPAPAQTPGGMLADAPQQASAPASQATMPAPGPSSSGPQGMLSAASGSPSAAPSSPQTAIAPADDYAARRSSIQREIEALSPLIAHPHTRQFAAGRLATLQEKLSDLDNPEHAAKLDLLRSNADLARSRAKFFRDRLGGEPAGMLSDPLKGVGMNQDGTLTEKTTGSMDETAGDGSGIDLDTGLAKGMLRTPDGMVMAPKQWQQRAMDGNAAISESSDRDRLAKYLRNQQLWVHIKGKAPSGYEYNEDGSLRDLKDASKKAIGLDKIQALLDDVKAAKGVLVDNSNFASRGLATATNGIMFPQKQQAMDAVGHAVAQLTAEIEGKRHARAQDVMFLKFFQPKWSDSSEMIGFKLDQLNRIFSNYFGAKVNPGAVFESEFSKAKDAYYKKMGMQKDGQAGASGQPQKAGGDDLSGVPTDELLRRLGK